ncbi:S9 family peptidase [Algoriphagus boritolerans]|uniref:Dipeptidyl aminopeptidase/acylaminoacyl peptidase n=1 Tax=Algoriphagus boritolerans DSM 17298 = JCM 18970 TaxID=1120964 RepID=A0A1H5Y706_9BACT|nr:DPP IV N-terminal domain-containing protein [Algoriphagus boritolerans]SEG19774.1 Dipeptidyl aminopeptidase/acylaminoacyl peptidase [Algoriphagus boritolerans DSM 17298 = JCM 18970]
MMLRKYLFPSILLFWLILGHSESLQAQITENTYQRAAYFLTGNLEKQVYHLEVVPNWLEGSQGFVHATFTSEGKRFYKTNTSPFETTAAFDPPVLAKLLQEKTGEVIDQANLPIERVFLSNGKTVTFLWKNQNWTWNMENNSLNAIPVTERNEMESFSPDRKWKAFSRNYNLFIKNLTTGEEIQLSTDGRKDFEYASFWGWSDLIYGENGERPAHFMVNWSPDSRKIFTQIVDLRIAEKMYLLDWSKDEKFRPELLSYFRGSPGDSTVVNYIPVIFDLEKKTEKKLPELTAPHFIGINLRWSDDGKKLSGFQIPRGYKQYHLIELDADTFETRRIISESSPTHVNRDNIFRRLKNEQFILSSEKSGWNHLYRFDWKSGKEINAITSGEYVVNKLTYLDEENGLIYFEASGKEQGRNPYFNHLYRVNLDGTDLQLLTPENAYHEIYISPDGKLAVDNYSTVDQPTQSILMDLKTGKHLQKISEADISNLKSLGYKSPVPFTATAKDGKTEIQGVYFLPTSFNAKKKYPIIDYTYSGPHTSTTPKTFKAGLLGHQQPMAELGFVVVTVDGMGGFGRSKAFSDASYRNLGDGTTDHVLAITQLASKNSFLDITKVGIFGHSAGGYDAGRAMLLHPDFYKVGVASAGDHDFRMEKAWWPEMYMGYPVGDFYHEQSNITNAANLKGHLLLAHGGIDENVNPSATFKLAENLIKAGKDFDLFIWPSRNHSFGRPPGDYFTKKRWDYFIEHLMGEKPIRHYQLQITD